MSDIIGQLHALSEDSTDSRTQNVCEAAAVVIQELRDELLTVQQAYVICRGILNDVDPTRERRKASSGIGPIGGSHVFRGSQTLARLG